MALSNPTEAQGAAARPEVAKAEDKPPKPEIDLQALAERLYRLFREEARLERERLGGPRPW
jgi:hypothetical protein